MKKLTFSTILLFFYAFVATSIAEDMQHQMHHAKKGSMRMMDKGKMETHMRTMQAEMLAIHDLSNKILAEKNPLQKQKLKDEQLELIKEHHKKMMMHKKQMMK